MKRLIIVLGVVISGNVFGQTYTLKKCIEIATKNNPTYQKAVLNAEMANANISSAKSNQLPQTSLNFSQGMNFGRSIDRFSNDYINQLYNSTFGNVQLSMPIYKGFQKQYLIESAKTLQDAEIFNIETEKNKLSLAILKAYLDVLASQEMLEVSKKTLENSKLQFERQSKLLEAGISGKWELMQFNNQVTTDEGAFIDAQYNLKIIKLVLFQLMNIKADEKIEFQQIIPFEIDQNLNLMENINSLDFLPEYKSYELQQNSFDLLIKANKAENMPELSLFTYYSTFYASTNPERNFFQQVNDTRNGSVSLNLSIPIFSKFQTSPKTQQLTVQKKLAENTKSIFQNSINQEIETARLLLTTFSEKYKNANNQVELNKENMKMVQLRIDAGTINPLEFTIAQTNLQKSYSNQIQTKFRWILQKKILNFYESGEFDFL